MSHEPVPHVNDTEIAYLRTRKIASSADVVNRLLDEIERLKSGNLTKTEFHALCHNLHASGCPISWGEHVQGCDEFRRELFGDVQPDPDCKFCSGTGVIYQYERSGPDIVGGEAETCSCVTRRQANSEQLSVSQQVANDRSADVATGQCAQNAVVGETSDNAAH